MINEATSDQSRAQEPLIPLVKDPPTKILALRACYFAFQMVKIGPFILSRLTLSGLKQLRFT